MSSCLPSKFIQIFFIICSSVFCLVSVLEAQHVFSFACNARYQKRPGKTSTSRLVQVNFIASFVFVFLYSAVSTPAVSRSIKTDTHRPTRFNAGTIFTCLGTLEPRVIHEKFWWVAVKSSYRSGLVH